MEKASVTGILHGALVIWKTLREHPEVSAQVETDTCKRFNAGQLRRLYFVG